MISIKHLSAFAILISFALISNAQDRLISSRNPNGLAVSTGNLYFTSNDNAGAAVWRISQNGVPGQERILYWEAGAKFGDIVYAQSGSNFFGYFFAQKSNVITIRRVSLAGGNATIVGTITNVDIDNSHHNLITDGTHLYWQDDRAIRKMAVSGGDIIVLDETRPNTPTAGIDIRNDRIIYADVDKIRYVPTAGATTTPAVRTIAEATNPVTALHAAASYIYWGERNGAVRRKASGLPIQTLQSSNGRITLSISSSGTKYAWIQCGSSSCELKRSVGSTITIGANGLGLFISSAGTIFFGDDGGVHRRPF